MQEPIETFLGYFRDICPLLTDAELSHLGSCVSIRDLKKSQYFIRAGELQKDLGFITKGLVRSYYIDIHGNDESTRFLKDGQFVSDYAALLRNEPTRYNFRCLEPTTIVVLPFDVVIQSYENSHQFERFGRIVAEKSCQMHQARIEAFLFETAEQRYLNFLSQQQELFNRISITHLCSYLGIKRQSLTRIRKKLMISGYQSSLPQK